MIIRRRRFHFIAIVALALAGCVWAWAYTHGLWVRDAERIAKGMTRDEVIAILGRAPDADDTLSIPGNRLEFWIVIDGTIAVSFGAGDHVIAHDVHRENALIWQIKRICGMVR